MPCNGDCQQGRTCNCEYKDAIANQISDAITLSATAGQFKNRGTKMTKHKWYKEIQAWSEGAEIEIKYLEGAGSKSGWMVMNDPDWDCYDVEYRIKPQPKEPQYLYAYIFNGTAMLTETKAGAANGARYIGKIEVQDD